MWSRAGWVGRGTRERGGKQRVHVGRVWDGEQSLLVLLPHDEHLQRPRWRRGRVGVGRRRRGRREVEGRQKPHI